IDIVQLVAPTAFAVDAAGNDQHGNAVQPCLANATGRVGDACCRNDHQGADARSGAAEGIGHEGRAAFVGHQRRLDAVRSVQLVVQLGVVYPGDTEGVADAQLFQGETCQCGAGFLHGSIPCSHVFVACPAMACAARRPLRMQLERKVPSSERIPLMPPPPKPAASPAAYRPETGSPWASSTRECRSVSMPPMLLRLIRRVRMAISGPPPEFMIGCTRQMRSRSPRHCRNCCRRRSCSSLYSDGPRRMPAS